MNSKNNLIIILSSLLLLSVIMTVYGFLSKGKAVKPVLMVIKGMEYNYGDEDGFGKTGFWDNYPYWVLLSQGEKIDSSIQIQESNGDNNIILNNFLTKGNRLFFRCNLEKGQYQLMDTTLQIIKLSKANVVILADLPSERYLQRNEAYNIIKQKLYLLQVPLKLIAEESHLSYFFAVDSENKIADMYFPRMETPEMTVKYLEEMKKINK